MPRIVVMKDRAPLVLRKSDIKGDDLWVCRCGLSANWPLCDDSHNETKGEQKGALYAYCRKAQDGPLVRADAGAHPEADPRPWDAGNRKLADAIKANE